MKKFFMYCFAIIIILSICKIATTMHFYKIYDYKSTEYKIDGGEIFAKLIGTYQDIAKQKTVLSKPYELFVSFQYKHRNISKVNIKEIKLIDIDKQEIVFTRNGVTSSIKTSGFERNAKYFLASVRFTFDDLDLDYSKYKLHIIYTEAENTTVENEAELLFEKDYREYWSSDILEIPYPIIKVKN